MVSLSCLLKLWVFGHSFMFTLNCMYCIGMGGYCPGGDCPGVIVRGLLSGGYFPGGYCPVTKLLIPNTQKSQLSGLVALVRILK